MDNLMGDRLRELRKALNLSQEELGARIGTTKGTISRIELNQVKFMNQNLTAICKEFRVRREWLETGQGEMFEPDPVNEIDRLVEAYRLSPLGRQFLEVLVTLTDDQLEVIRDLVFSMAKTLQPAADKPEEKPPDKPEEATVDGWTEQDYIDEVKAEFALEKKRKGVSEAS